MLAEPATITGGFIDPPAVSPVSHGVDLSDGDGDYHVTFRADDTASELIARINATTGATITASVSAEGRLVLTTVETGPGARLSVVRGEALPMLGLERGASASGR